MKIKLGNRRRVIENLVTQSK